MPSEAVDRLERSAGRTAIPEPDQPKRGRAERAARRPRPRRALVFVAILAVAWLAVARAQHPRASLRPTEPGATTPGSVETVPRVETVDGVVVETFTPPDAAAYYTLRVGAPSPARAGPPACARGEEDDRAWSRPEAPAVMVGRYRCRVEGGRAAMWWHDDRGQVVHATAADADLARLFAWWRVHT